MQEVLARDAVAVGEAHQPAFEADQALVDVVELLDQRIDARLVEPQRLHLGDDLVLQLLVFALLRRRQRLVLQLAARCPGPAACAASCRCRRSLSKVSTTFGFSSASIAASDSAFSNVVVVHVGFGGAASAGILLLAVGAGRGAALERRRRRRGGGAGGGGAAAAPSIAGRAIGAGRPIGAMSLGVGAGIGRFEIDDVAQEDLAFVELVAPDDDGLEGQRAFAQAGDHRLAAGLDALGDGDFALAREQLDRAHLAQIHAHRIVGAVARLGFLVSATRLGGDLDQFAVARRRRPPRLASLPRRRSSSSCSTTLMPISESIDMMSSICSEVTSSDGSTAFSSS